MIIVIWLRYLMTSAYVHLKSSYDLLRMTQSVEMNTRKRHSKATSIWSNFVYNIYYTLR